MGFIIKLLYRFAIQHTLKFPKKDVVLPFNWIWVADCWIHWRRKITCNVTRSFSRLVLLNTKIHFSFIFKLMKLATSTVKCDLRRIRQEWSQDWLWQTMLRRWSHIRVFQFADFYSNYFILKIEIIIVYIIHRVYFIIF